MPPKKKIKQILADLSGDEKELMLGELLRAIEVSKREGSFDAIEECLASWEATIELSKTPGVKEKVWERYDRLKKAGIIHDGKLDN